MVREAQLDNQAIVVEFAQMIEHAADVKTELQYQIMQRDLQISYLTGCLTGSSDLLTLEVLSEDLARAREFTLELTNSARIANRRRK
jgi:hypothetical protein